jgi:tetratricopeptide (TPR) repeat protein
MKRIALVVISLALGTITFAQKNEVTNAYLGYTHYVKEKDPDELAKAKVAIDKASLDASTSGDPKTWTYRGQIYIALYQKEFNEKMISHKDMTDGAKKASTSYLETSTANLVEATNAFLKAKTLDVHKVYVDDISKGLGDCYFFLQNAGIGRFNQKMYPDALPMFELASDILAADHKFDTINIGNAASCAYNGKIYDKAISNYKKLADAGSGKGNTWMMLGRVYAESGDSAKYITTISDGLKKYPMDADLLTEDVNIKMAHGQATAAIDELNALVAQRPNDSQLNAVVGNVYDRMANPVGADGKLAPKPANYEDLIAKAIQYYSKAIELDPKAFDANYNLGALYYNQSVYYYDQSQLTIASASKYKDMWEKPLPNAAKYLEAAHALEPKDMTTLQALKACYSQMSDQENYMRIKEEIKKLQAGG